MNPRELLPDDWPVLAAALVQLRLYRRGLTPQTNHIIEAVRLLRLKPTRSPSGLAGVETRLQELLSELDKELS